MDGGVAGRWHLKGRGLENTGQTFLRGVTNLFSSTWPRWTGTASQTLTPAPGLPDAVPHQPGSMVRWILPARPAGHSLPVPAGRSLAVRAAPPSSPFCREESGRRPQKRLPASTTNNGKEDGRRCGTSSLERQCGLGELSRSSALRRSPRRSWQDGAVRPRGSPGDPLVWVPSSAVGGRAPSRPSPGLRPARGLSGDGRRTAAALSFRGQRQDAASSTATGRGRLQHRAEGT